MKKNRIIAIVLAVALVGSLAGVSAFAASGNTQSTPAADTAAQKKDVQETAASHTSSETVYVIANADGSARRSSSARSMTWTIPTPHRRPSPP